MATTRTTNQARDELNAAFRTHWLAEGESESILAWPNVDFNTEGVSEFVRYSVLHNRGEQASLGMGGDRYFRRYGMIIAQVFVAEERLEAVHGSPQHRAVRQRLCGSLWQVEFERLVEHLKGSLHGVHWVERVPVFAEQVAIVQQRLQGVWHAPVKKKARTEALGQKRAS